MLEKDLVLCLCRWPLTEKRRAKAKKLIARGVNWDVFFETASQWDLDPVVSLNLGLDGDNSVPPGILDKALARQKEVRAHALTHALKTNHTLGLLAQQGIDAIVLKGAAVALSAYGDSSLRTSADIDLLLHEEQLKNARAALVSAGFNTDYDVAREDRLISRGHALELSNGKSKVELHSVLMPHHMRWNIRTEELWGACRQVDCAGGSIKVLSAEAEFLFVCAHAAKHHFHGWKWLCDIAQLAARLDADQVNRVMSLAARTHSRRIVAIALRVVRATIGGDDRFPEHALMSEARTRRTVSLVLNDIGIYDRAAPAASELSARIDPGLALLLFWSRTRERWSDRVWPIVEVILVPTENDMGANKSRWAQRPLRLAARALRNFASPW